MVWSARLKIQVHEAASSTDLRVRLVSGAVVSLFQFGTVIPITESVYASSTSLTPLTPEQLVTNSLGELEVWKPTATRLSVQATKSGLNVTTTEEFVWNPGDLGLIFDVRTRGAVGDGIVLTNGAMVSGTATLTSSSNAFTASMVGMPITVMNPGIQVYQDNSISTNASATAATSNGSPFRTADIGKKITISNGGAGGVPFVSKVVSLNSAASAQMAALATNTASGGTLTIEPYFLRTTVAAYVSAGQITLANVAPDTISGATVAWGTNDHDAIQAAIDAAHAAPGGGTVEFSGGVGSVFMTSPLTIYSNVSFRGDGCCLRRLPGATGTLIKTATTATALANASFDDLVIDNDFASADVVFQVGTGSSRVKFEHVTINGTRQANAISLQRLDGGANSGTNSDIQILRCTINGNGTNNGGTIGIPNGQRVRIEDCDFSLINSIALEMSPDATNPLSYDVRFINNRIDDGSCSNLFVGVFATGQTAEDILVTGNIWRTVGWQQRKGAVIVNNNSPAGSFTRRVKITDNIVHGWGGLELGTAIVVNGDLNGQGLATVNEDIDIRGNSLDATFAPTTRAYGVAEAEPFFDLQGIILLGASRFSIDDNIIKYCGGAGIHIHSCTAGTVSRNKVSLCQRMVSSVAVQTEAYGGINVHSACTHVTFAHNVVTDTGLGNAGTPYQVWAGIGVAAGVETSSGSTPANSSNGGLTIISSTHLTFIGNRCYDTRGTKYQKYGIRLGFDPNSAAQGVDPNEAFVATPASATQPSDCLVMDNDLTGNLTDGLYVPLDSTGRALDRSHTIRNNTGCSAGQGQLLFSGPCTNAVASVINIPAVVPLAAVLYIEARTGDVVGSGYYAVNRTNSAAAAQTPSVVWGAVAQGGGLVPALASNNAGAASWNVTPTLTGTLTVIMLHTKVA